MSNWLVLKWLLLVVSLSQPTYTETQHQGVEWSCLAAITQSSGTKPHQWHDDAIAKAKVAGRWWRCCVVLCGGRGAPDAEADAEEEEEAGRG